MLVEMRSYTMKKYKWARVLILLLLILYAILSFFKAEIREFKPIYVLIVIISFYLLYRVLKRD